MQIESTRDRTAF